MLPFLAARSPGGRVGRQIERYAAALERLYDAIGRVTGARIIVDSSKLATHGFLLRKIGLDLRVLHLIRDSRAVAFSWQRPPSWGHLFPTHSVPTFSATGSSVRWLMYNAQVSLLGRQGLPYLRLRYEDLVRDPMGTVDRVLEWLRIPPEHRAIPFVAADEVFLAPCHTVDGNPIRFRRGAVRVQADERWRTQLSRRDRTLVTAATLPGLVRYGYLPFKP
jgi:hypothetical protein